LTISHLKIEVSPRNPLGTPFSNPEKGPKSEENDCPTIRRLGMSLTYTQTLVAISIAESS